MRLEQAGICLNSASSMVDLVQYHSVVWKYQEERKKDFHFTLYLPLKITKLKKTVTWWRFVR